MNKSLSEFLLQHVSNQQSTTNINNCSKPNPSTPRQPRDVGFVFHSKFKLSVYLPKKLAIIFCYRIADASSSSPLLATPIFFLPPPYEDIYPEDLNVASMADVSFTASIISFFKKIRFWCDNAFLFIVNFLKSLYRKNNDVLTSNN